MTKEALGETKNASQWAQAALAASARGDSHEAITHYQRALSLSEQPQWALALIELYLGASRFEEAQALLTWLLLSEHDGAAVLEQARVLQAKLRNAS